MQVLAEPKAVLQHCLHIGFGDAHHVTVLCSDQGTLAAFCFADAEPFARVGMLAGVDLAVMLDLPCAIEQDPVIRG